MRKRAGLGAGARLDSSLDAWYLIIRLYNHSVIEIWTYEMRAASDSLSVTFHALADPTRRAILARLASGAATVKELAAPFEMSGPAVSKHLRVLEHAGLIQRGRAAQWRPRTLDAKPLREVAEWAEEFRRFWDASYARLDTYLQHLTQQENTDAQPS
jgi:DNA-binding transcriptional ArsR family regulator